MKEPRKFKAPYNPKERTRQEADRLRVAHPAGRELPVITLDLAEFDFDLDLMPVNGLREQLDTDALLMGDLESILVTIHQNRKSPKFPIRRNEARLLRRIHLALGR